MFKIKLPKEKPTWEYSMPKKGNERRKSYMQGYDEGISKIKNLLEDSMMRGYLRERFDEIFEKDQEAIDGIRPSKSNRSGALLLWSEILNEIRKLK